MPAALERKLKKEASKKGFKGEKKDAYIYGTLRKTGWKPEREKKMSETSNLVRLNEIGKNLDSVISFAYDDDNRRTLAGSLVKTGAAGGLAGAGLYGYGLTRRGVAPGGIFKAAGQDWHNVRSAVGEGRIPSAAMGDIGRSVGAGARGVGTQIGYALKKLKALLPGTKLSSKSEEVKFKSNLLEPFSDGAVPHSKIIEEEFPAGLSPAAVLRFPFPKLMRYLNRPQQLQQQWSGLASKLNDIIKFEEKKGYQARPFQRYFLGPGYTSAIHAKEGMKAKAFFHTTGRQIGETYAGMGIGTGIGAGIAAGVGAIKGGKAGAKAAAPLGALIGSYGGAIGGALHGTYGKRATQLYKRYTGQENLSSLLDDLIAFDADPKKKISGQPLKR